MSSEKRPRVIGDGWAKLRQHTPARIALGRAGTSLPTEPHLAFQLAHARARDAVHHELDAEALRVALQPLGLEIIKLHSRADHRRAYLQRPDLGRRLDDESRAKLETLAIGSEACEAAFVIGDGLSAMAIEENAAPFLRTMLPSLTGDRRVAPLSIVQQARVAIGDEIGQVLRAKIVVMLIGERPGLSSPDSMGIYMTHSPHIGLTDESRNCISNVRPQGLNYDQAAYKLHYLMTEARRRGISGVALKDEAEALPAAEPASAGNFLLK